MKKRLRFKYVAMFFVALLMSLGGLITGCFEMGGWRPDAPEITMHSDSMSITWDVVENASQYEVYCNGTRCSTVYPDQAISDSLIYTFDKKLTQTGEYEFYVLALHRGTRESEKSNTEKYNCLAVPVTTSQRLGLFNSNPITDEGIIVNVNGTQVNINLNGIEADAYELYLYSESTGLNVYPINLNEKTSTGWYSISIAGFIQPKYNDIYAIRIGTVDGDEHTIASKINYYNPYSYGEYTSAKNIYLFDGTINDAYINSIQELRNIVYYNFIYRMPVQSIRISHSFENLLKKLYSEGGSLSIVDSLAYAVTDCFNYFYETRDAYSIQVRYVANYEFEIEINYDAAVYQNQDAKSEPAYNLYPKECVYDEIEWDTFYDTCGYTMRKDDPKYTFTPYEFPSDKQFLYAEVESSEELYWAIENNYTPICVENSKAESMYNNIKDILNSIISDQMTDYEKTFSIFDYICANTSYDYFSTIADNPKTIKVEGYGNVAAALIPAYYLEGVFDTKYAVCDGFSKAFSVMCNMENIEAIRVAGRSETTNDDSAGGHAWNKVRLDLNPNDEIGAQYYLVDITWTEKIASSYFKSNGDDGREASTHEYFLVDDSYCSSHFAFDKRDKYSNLKTNGRFNYYDNTFFEFDATSYNLPNAVVGDYHDLVIRNTPELQAMYYYMLVEGRESIEVVLDYDYIVNVHKSKGGTANDNFISMKNSLLQEMSDFNFETQYIVLNSNNFELVTYNSEKEKGVIVVLEQRHKFDDENDAGFLIGFLDHYNITADYEIYVDHYLLVQNNGVNIEQRLINMLNKELQGKNLTIEVEYVATHTSLTEISYEFKVSFNSAS